MPSSTSSSEERDPPDAMGKTWILTLVLMLLVLGSWEGFLRAKGFVPSLNDIPGGEETSWDVARTRVRFARSSTYVILGASRAEHCIVPEIIMEKTGTAKPILLTISGSPPTPILRDLAEDPGIDNPIICAVWPSGFFDGSRSNEPRPIQWLENWHAMRFPTVFEFWLKEFVATSFAFRHRVVAPKKIAKALWTGGEWPTPQYFVVRRDRSVRAEHDRYKSFRNSMADTLEEWEAYQKNWFRTNCTVPTEEEFEAFLVDLEPLVERIKARGGKVVFLRCPSTGEIREIERERFPRKKYWDRMAARIKAPAIHFEDYPGLNVPCRDGSHMDFKESVRFSNTLADILNNL